MSDPDLSRPELATALVDATDGRWAERRRHAREHLSGEAFLPPVEPIDLSEYRTRVMGQLRELAEHDWARRGFPESVGGQDDLGGTMTDFEMLAFGDLSLMVKAGVQWGLFGGAIAALGTDSHHRRYLDDAITARVPGCFAMTEVDHGSDVQGLETTATYDESTGEFVIETPHPGATKTYIGNAARDGRLAVVFAQLVTGGTSYGVHAVVVPIREEDGSPATGVTIGDNGAKGGLPGVDNGTLAFDGVRVPRTALLDRFGSVAEDGTYTSPIEGDSRRFFTMLGTLVRGRISIAGAAGSATKTALTHAIRYGARRRQFGAPGRDDDVPLLDYRAHQRKLLPALATSYALHFAQGELVGQLHDLQSDDAASETARRELETRAAGLKAIGTWHATSTIQTCREACGGAGYMWENRLPMLKADTDVFTTFEGDNTVLLQLVGKGMLTRYRDEFGELDTLGAVRFGARQFADVVIERTAARTVIQRLVDAVSTKDAEEVSLLDRGLHLRMFEDREAHALETLAARIRGAGDDDPFEAVNDSQDHLLFAARAHVHRIVLEAFVAGIEGCPDGEARQTLSSLCDLYALANVEADRGWFLEHDRLSPARSKAITAQVNRLCAELRPRALDLVGGFGIPDHWLTAPIATGATPAGVAEST